MVFVRETCGLRTGNVVCVDADVILLVGVVAVAVLVLVIDGGAPTTIR